MRRGVLAAALRCSPPPLTFRGFFRVFCLYPPAPRSAPREQIPGGGFAEPWIPALRDPGGFAQGSRSVGLVRSESSSGAGSVPRYEA